MNGLNLRIPRTMDLTGVMQAVSVLAVLALLGLWAAVIRRR